MAWAVMVPFESACKRGRGIFIGPLLGRLIRHAQRLRRLRRAGVLFRGAGDGAGLGWVPRAWRPRRTHLLRWVRTHVIRVHRGRRWRRLAVHRWHVGLPLGNFARSVNVAVFKRKASLRKRRRQLGAAATARLFDWKLRRIKDVRAGTRRQTSLVHDPRVELQLRGVGV